jgi:hypothetical protein
MAPKSRYSPQGPVRLVVLATSPNALPIASRPVEVTISRAPPLSAAVADVGCVRRCRLLIRRCRLFSPMLAVVALISAAMLAIVTGVCYCRYRYYR